MDQVYHLEAGPERVRRLWGVLRANFLAGARYVPRALSRPGDRSSAPTPDAWPIRRPDDGLGTGSRPEA